MASTVTESLQVSFDEDAFGEHGEDNLPLTLTLGNDDPEETSPPWQALRVFPAIGGVEHHASRGQVEYFGRGGQLERSEFLQFSNSQSSNTQFPINPGGVTVEISFAFDIEGNALQNNQLSFVAAPYRNRIDSNRPFVGAIKIVYTSSYKILRYQPEGGEYISASGRFLYRNYGTVLAFRNGQFASLDIAPPVQQQTQEDFRKELYRVVSVVQVNENGAWEKHQDFETGGGWALGNSPRKGDVSLTEFHRVHEIGYISTMHPVTHAFNTLDVLIEQGPPVAAGFTPATLEMLLKPKGNFEGGPFMDIYGRVISGGRVVGDVRNRFPNVPVN